jgi:hypothetical protein
MGAGSWAWGGAYNTALWLDPVQRVTGVLLSRIRPWADAGVMDFFAQFERAVYVGGVGSGL